MEVSREVNGSSEDALAILAFALAVKLFPPLVHVVKLRLEVDENLNLLAFLVECIAHCSILKADILFEGNVGSDSLLHVGSTLNKLGNIKACNSNGQQTYGSKHAETTAYVVGNYERSVAFLVSTSAGCALLGIGDSNNDLASHLLTTLFLALLLEQTESKSRLCCSTTLGDIDDTKLAVLQILCEFVEIILADVVAGKEDVGILTLVGEPLETVSQSLDDGASTKIGTANACNNNCVAVLAKCLGAFLQLGHELGCNAGGQMEPAKEIVTCTGSSLESLLCLLCLRCESSNLLCTQQSLRIVKLNHIFIPKC